MEGTRFVNKQRRLHVTVIRTPGTRNAPINELFWRFHHTCLAMQAVLVVDAQFCCAVLRFHILVHVRRTEPLLRSVKDLQRNVVRNALHSLLHANMGELVLRIIDAAQRERVLSVKRDDLLRHSPLVSSHCPASHSHATEAFGSAEAASSSPSPLRERSTDASERARRAVCPTRTTR